MNRHHHAILRQHHAILRHHHQCPDARCCKQKDKAECWQHATMLELLGFSTHALTVYALLRAGVQDALVREGMTLYSFIRTRSPAFIGRVLVRPLPLPPLPPPLSHTTCTPRSLLAGTHCYHRAAPVTAAQDMATAGDPSSSRQLVVGRVQAGGHPCTRRPGVALPAWSVHRFGMAPRVLRAS